MEVIDKSKTHLKVVLENEGHTLPALVEDELTRDKNVEVGTYKITHPLIGKAEINVEGKNPKASLKSAAKNIQKDVSDFKKSFKKAFSK